MARRWRLRYMPLSRYIYPLSLSRSLSFWRRAVTGARACTRGPRALPYVRDARRTPSAPRDAASVARACACVSVSLAFSLCTCDRCLCVHNTHVGGCSCVLFIVVEGLTVVDSLFFASQRRASTRTHDAWYSMIMRIEKEER